MKVSHKWLQTFFKKPLPSSEEIAELLTFHIFEVEGIEKKANDDVLDVKVLPDRAAYCLSHEGIARELSALLLDNEFIPRNPPEIEASPDVKGIAVLIEAKDVCDAYSALSIIGISPRETPLWLRNNLEAVGQRSINFLVDLANFVMTDIGQPLHVFDAEKISGNISVRMANAGEKITTLDNKEVSLDSSVAVIGDDKTALAIAGIKGGKAAETTPHSTHVIVEAAHFDATAIRRTSMKLGIKTDASKRFENDSDRATPDVALRHFAALLQKEDPDALVGNIVSVGGEKIDAKKIIIDPKFISEKLGKEISADEILECLTRGSISARREGDMISVSPSSYRKDLNIEEDIVDEVGRLYGYKNIDAKLPRIEADQEMNHEISIRNKARNFLIQNGYSEIYTYALQSTGEAEIANPLASDKGFYRSNLSSAMDEKLKQNLYYADLLGLSKIKLFEFGRVYKGGREFLALSIGVAYKKAKKGERVNDEIKEIRDELFSALGSKVEILCTIDDSGGIISKAGKSIGTTNNIDGVMEVDFDTLTAGLSAENYANFDLQNIEAKYKPFSAYPFIVRDVAIWIPDGLDDNRVRDEFETIIDPAFGGTNLSITINFLDRFEKAGRISYAYRLAFQSFDKTLTDEEVNKIMEKIWDALKGKGFEVR
ncbi:MAG: phenylalanine--tRNA ligase subunit beta [Patescibacteria group bacterium]